MAHLLHTFIISYINNTCNAFYISLFVMHCLYIMHVIVNSFINVYLQRYYTYKVRKKSLSLNTQFANDVPQCVDDYDDKSYTIMLTAQLPLDKLQFKSWFKSELISRAENIVRYTIPTIAKTHLMDIIATHNYYTLVAIIQMYIDCRVYISQHFT